MTLSARQLGKLRLLAVIMLASMLGGGIYGGVVGLLETGHVRWGALAQGVFTGGCVSLWCASFDLFLSGTGPGIRLKRLTFGRFMAIKVLYWMIGIDGGIYLGQLLFSPLYGGTLWLPTDPMFLITFVIALTVAFAVNFVLEINTLLGQNVLRNFITGRYHQPREEQRIFLFVDMVDSTRIAERIGPVRFHRLLNDFFRDLTEPILAMHGEIYTYVGDQVIVTWPQARGAADARCINCLLMMRRRLQARADDYRARYGMAPTFRASLHAGPIVTGEMGDHKREIVFLGDTVNTTARLEQLCREQNLGELISGDLMRLVDLPHGVEAVPLGQHRIRGKENPVDVFTLRPGSDGPRERSAA